MRVRAWSLFAIVLGVSLLLSLSGAVAQTAPMMAPTAAEVQAPAVQSTNGYVRYNPNIASETATYYTVNEPFNNPNGCYLINANCVIIGGEPITPGSRYPGTTNGANFLACVLSVAGLETISCVRFSSRLNGPAPAHVIRNIDEILPNFNTLPVGWEEVAKNDALEELQEGDIAFVLNSNDVPCWAGVVRATINSPEVITDNSLLRIATHSFSDANRDLDFDNAWCDNPDQPDTVRYVRINGDYTPPTLAAVDRTVDYSIGATTLGWPDASDVGPDGITPQSGVRDYRITDVRGQDLTAASAAPQGSVALPMCSRIELRIAVTDNVGNEALVPLIVHVRQQGDFVPDGTINEADMNQLRAWLVGGTAPAYADMNGDGVVTADDELWLFLRLGETCQYF